MQMFYLFLSTYIILFASAEVGQRFVYSKVQWARKATHIGVIAILLPMPLYLSAIEILVLASIFTVGLVISRYKKLLSLHNVSRQTVGEILYPISIGMLALICLPHSIRAFQAGCLTLALSDGFAAVVGEQWPVKEFRILRNTKSLGGAFAFLTTTGLIVWLFPPLAPVGILALAGFVLLLTLSEFLLVQGFDNLVIPLMTAYFYLWW